MSCPDHGLTCVEAPDSQTAVGTESLDSCHPGWSLLMSCAGEHQLDLAPNTPQIIPLCQADHVSKHILQGNCPDTSVVDDPSLSSPQHSILKTMSSHDMTEDTGD